MIRIIQAYGRAVRSLFLPGMFFHFMWPVLASFILWVGVGIAFWGKLASAITKLLHLWPALVERMSDRFVSTSLHITLFLLSVPLMVVTSTLILESVALSFILDKVAKTEYPHLERRRGGSQWHSLRNTLKSSLIALLVTLTTIPLWIVPGVGVLVSLLSSTWLNYRSFRYDVLMSHADRQELSALPDGHRGRLLFLSLGASALALVPPLNLLSVPVAGLSFAHYLLSALHRQRETAKG
jgi:CysZ protein